MSERREDGVRRARGPGRGGPVAGLIAAILLAGLPLSGLAQEPAAAAPAISVAEQVFFQRLHDLVEARKWPEAQRHIQQLQALRTEPSWLAGREGELRLAQFKISRGQGDLTGMLNAARLFLNGDEVRSQQMLEMARQLKAAGEKAAAIAVLKEVVSRTPKYLPAQRLLAEWEPPAPKPPPRPKPKAEPVAPKPPPERKAAPATPEEEAAAHLAALRSHYAEENLIGVRSAARLFLNGDRERSQKLLEVAREFHGKGDTATALLLTREVLRRTPEFPPAQRLLAELEAPPKD
jgi:hypothetical protein